MAVLARRSADLLLLLALLACAATAAGGASVCDTANCGRGTCAEVPGGLPLPPNYECRCDPGWSRALNLVPFSPCIVPNCTFSDSCLNLTLAPPIGIPKDVCTVVSCGEGGACKAGGAMFSYSCECRPGYANLLNLNALPCVHNCFFGNDCYALGLGPAPSPLPPPSPAPTSGDHVPPGPSAPPPSGTKGSASSSPSRLQLLLLGMASIAMLQIV